MSLFDTEGITRSEPLPMQHWLVGVVYGGGTGNEPVEIAPQDIAYYVHCNSGMSPMAFMAWLAGELDLLDAIDPECSK